MPRWRRVGWTTAGAGVVAVVSTALAPGPLKTADFPWIDNPVGVAGLGLGTVAQLSLLVSLAGALVAVASLVVRYRRSRGVERLQRRRCSGRRGRASRSSWTGASTAASTTRG
jgi:hypothetical protein